MHPGITTKMIIRYTQYKNSVFATILSILGNSIHAIGAFLIIGYLCDLEGLREETSIIEMLIPVACFFAVGYGLNKLAERTAINKEKNRQREMAVKVEGGFCPNCGNDMKGIDICAFCGYVASLGEMPTEWKEEGQISPADSGTQEQLGTK